jgi:hypothetical protein
LPITTNLAKKQEEVIAKNKQRGVNLGFETIVKSKKNSHFSKGKISLTPMEIIFIFQENWNIWKD